MNGQGGQLITAGNEQRRRNADKQVEWPVNRGDVIDVESVTGLLSAADRTYNSLSRFIRDRSGGGGNKRGSRTEEKEHRTANGGDEEEATSYTDKNMESVHEKLSSMTLDNADNLVRRLQSVACTPGVDPTANDEWRDTFEPMFKLPTNMFGLAAMGTTSSDEWAEAERNARTILQNGKRLKEEALRKGAPKITMFAGIAAATVLGGLTMSITASADIFLGTDNALAKVMKDNALGITMAVGGIVMGIADDLEQVIYHGDSWRRVPQNALAKIAQQGLSQGSAWLLGTIALPLGGPIGAIVIQIVGGAVFSMATSFVVRAIAFKGQRETEALLADSIRRETEQMRQWELDASRALKGGKTISADIFSLHPEVTAGLLGNIGRWTKENADVVYLMGIAALCYGAPYTPFESVLELAFPGGKMVADQYIDSRLLQGKIIPWAVKKMMALPFREPFRSLARRSFGSILNKSKRGKRVSEWLDRAINDRSSSVAQVAMVISELIASSTGAILVNEGGLNMKTIKAIAEPENMHVLWAEARNIIQGKHSGDPFAAMSAFVEVANTAIKHGAVSLKNGDVIYDRESNGARFFCDYESGILRSLVAGGEDIALSELPLYAGRDQLAVKRGPEGEEIYARFVDMSWSVLVATPGFEASLAEQAVALGFSRKSIIDNAAVINKNRREQAEAIQNFNVVTAGKQQMVEDSIEKTNNLLASWEALQDAGNAQKLGYLSFMLAPGSREGSLQYASKYLPNGQQSSPAEIEAAMRALKRDIIMPDVERARSSQEELNATKAFFNEHITAARQAIDDSVIGFSKALRAFVESGGAPNGKVARYNMDTTGMESALGGLRGAQIRMDRIAVPTPASHPRGGESFATTPSAGQKAPSETTTDKQPTAMTKTVEPKWSKKYAQRQGMTKEQLNAIDMFETNMQSIAERFSMGMSTKTQTMSAFMTKMAQALSNGSDVTPAQMELLQEGLEDWRNGVEEAINRIHNINPPSGELGCAQVAGKLRVRSDPGGVITVVNDATGAVVPSECLMTPIAPALYKLIRTVAPHIAATTVTSFVAILSLVFPTIVGPFLKSVGPLKMNAILSQAITWIIIMWEQGVVSMSTVCDRDENVLPGSDFTCDMNAFFSTLICATNPSLLYCASRTTTDYAYINSAEVFAALLGTKSDKNENETAQRNAALGLFEMIGNEKAAKEATDKRIKEELAKQEAETRRIAQEEANSEQQGWLEGFVRTAARAAEAATGAWNGIQNFTETTTSLIASITNWLGVLVDSISSLSVELRDLVLFGSKDLSTMRQKATPLFDRDDFEHGWSTTPLMLTSWFVSTVSRMEGALGAAGESVQTTARLFTVIACYMVPQLKSHRICGVTKNNAEELLAEEPEVSAVWSDIKQYPELLAHTRSSTTNLWQYVTSSGLVFMAPINTVYLDMKREFLADIRPAQHREALQEFLSQFFVLAPSGSSERGIPEVFDATDSLGRHSTWTVDERDRRERFRYTGWTPVQIFGANTKKE